MVSRKPRRAQGASRAHRIPSVLESQKSSNSARSRGGVAPSCQPRNASSACTSKAGCWPCAVGGGGPSPTMSASLFEKLFVSAMTRHLPAAASEPDGELAQHAAVTVKEGTSYAPDRLHDTSIELAALPHHAPEQLTVPFSRREVPAESAARRSPHVRRCATYLQGAPGMLAERKFYMETGWVRGTMLAYSLALAVSGIGRVVDLGVGELPAKLLVKREERYLPPLEFLPRPA